MLRFGYLLLHEGNWNGNQVVPQDFVQQATRRSTYNPHYPYSLQFNINDSGQIPGIPKDAFWKSGSGGHSLVVIPSLDLVVWILGGRDSQYSPANTGFEIHPDATRAAEDRSDWKTTIGSDVDPRTEILKTILASIKN
jgi:CubicO group peptidase (beta-lactamase class C family)